MAAHSTPWTRSDVPVHHQAVTASIDLDHVAVAVEHRHEAWPRYRRDLGGRWASSGETVGFALNQLSFDNGMRIEILRPNQVEKNDFLRRFLDHRGPGPHHLTYKVPDIEQALAVAEGAGYPAVNVDLSDPYWKEAFLHPKVAHGVVVQMAESHDEGWVPSPPPDDLPPPAADRPADLVRVTLTVESVDDALGLFQNVLEGEPAEEGPGWVELAWPGPGRLRLVQSDDGSSGVDHIAFALDDPSGVPDAHPRDDGTWVVPPEANLGTRLVLSVRTP
jgi:methylmalonyl-CoA/ethylmalonyl-CoA epimerase